MLRADGDGWRSALRVSSLGDQLYFHSAYPTCEPNAVFFGPDTYRFLRALQAELARAGRSRARSTSAAAPARRRSRSRCTGRRPKCWRSTSTTSAAT